MPEPGRDSAARAPQPTHRTDAEQGADRTEAEQVAPRSPEPEPVLPSRTADETDVGWGDAEPFADDDLRRLTDEVPPHHLDRD
jgi:hypothetical protein